MIQNFILGVMLVFSAFLMVYMVYVLIGDLLGAPFVPLEKAEVEDILKKIKPEKGKIFVDLGSGDGRVVMAAAQKFGVKAVGVEIHPLLVWWAKLLAHKKGVSNAVFYRTSFWGFDISNADYIFCYLFPGTMEKVAKKLDREAKKGCTVIAVDFRIKMWTDKLTEKFETKKYTVYVYRV
jgi:predicted RNA methylase